VTDNSLFVLNSVQDQGFSKDRAHRGKCGT